MLDTQDLQAIRGLMKEEIHVLDVKIEQTEKNIMVAVGSIIAEGNRNIIHAVGEMLEDNVFPQFEEIHRELRRMNTLVGWQR